MLGRGWPFFYVEIKYSLRFFDCPRYLCSLNTCAFINASVLVQCSRMQWCGCLNWKRRVRLIFILAIKHKLGFCCFLCKAWQQTHFITRSRYGHQLSISGLAVSWGICLFKLHSQRVTVWHLSTDDTDSSDHAHGWCFSSVVDWQLQRDVDFSDENDNRPMSHWRHELFF